MNEKNVIEIFRKQNIDFLLTLPCDKIRRFLSVLYEEKGLEFVPVNKEEDGVGICAGAYLAGRRPMMVIQSSGLGNSMNALMSLIVAYKMPLPILASWRGVYNEGIAAQFPFSKDLPKALEAWNIPYKKIMEPEELPLLNEVIRDAFQNNTPYVALVSPKIWQDESYVPPPPDTFPSRSRETNVEFKRTIREPEFNRAEAIQMIAEHLDEHAAVSNIGVASKELFAAKDRGLNFYMTGSWSQASPIGLGISLATPRKTVVIDGDGSLLCTSVLAVIADKKPKNLFIFCLDNGTYATTGDQITCAFNQIDMELYARAMGFTNTQKVQTRHELHDACKDMTNGPKFIHVLIRPGNTNVKNIPLPLEQIRDRFRKAVKL